MEDDALCSFLGSCCKQMGKISIPGESFGQFPLIRVSPIENSPIAALKLGLGMAVFPSPAPKGIPCVFKTFVENMNLLRLKLVINLHEDSTNNSNSSHLLSTYYTAAMALST